MPTTPRRPKDVDLRSQLRKQLRKVKKRVNSQASASKNNHQTTASEKWKIYKSTFEESRQKHRDLMQGTLDLTIVSARNLNSGTVGHDDSSSHMINPKCHVQLNNATSIVASNTIVHHLELETTECCKHETVVHYKTNNPIWNKTMKWRTRNFRCNSTLSFQIYNLAVDGKLILMGTTTLPIGKLVFATHDDHDPLDVSLHRGQINRQKKALPLVLSNEGNNNDDNDSNKHGRLHIEWSYKPDGCPIAARGIDMITNGIREGLNLKIFLKQLKIKGLRAIGRFSHTPCIDNPKLIVPLLKDVYSDLSLYTSGLPQSNDSNGSVNSSDVIEIEDDEFKSLLALVMHKTNDDISNSGLVRGMDYDGSGKVSQFESTSFFLSRSQSEATSHADEGAYHISAGYCRRVATSCGAGGVKSLCGLKKSHDDNFGNAIVVGKSDGGAQVYSENLRKVVKLDCPSIVHRSIDLPPSKFNQQHIARKVFLACSDRRIRVYEFPKRWETIRVGHTHKDITPYHEIVQPTVPLSLGLFQLDYNASIYHHDGMEYDSDKRSDSNEISSSLNGAPSSYLIIGGSTGTITIRDSMMLDSIITTYEQAHEDGITCIRRVNNSNLNTILTAGMDGRVNFIDPLRLDGTNKSISTIFQAANGIMAIDWSDTRHSLYTGDYSQRIKIWDPMVKKSTGILGTFGSSGHREMLTSVICNDKLNQIISTDVSGLIKIWDTRTLSCLQTVKDKEQHSATGVVASISDDSSRLITGGITLHRWKILDAKEERESRFQRLNRAKKIKVKKKIAHSVVTDGTSILGNKKMTANATSITHVKAPPLTKEERKKISDNVTSQKPDRTLFCLSTKQHNVFVTVTADGHVNVCQFGFYTPPTLRSQKDTEKDVDIQIQNQQNENHTRALDTTGDGIYDAIGLDTTNDGHINGIDTNGDGHINFEIGGLQHYLRKSSSSMNEDVDLPHNSLKDASLRNVTTKIISSFKVELKHTSLVTAAVLNHNSRSVYIGSSDGECRQFNLETGWLITTFESRSTEISCLSLLHVHGDGFRLMCGGWDGDLCGWDKNGRTVVVHTDGHNDGDVTCLCQIEEAFMVSGDSCGIICLWSTISKAPTQINASLNKFYNSNTSKNYDSIGLSNLPISIECLCYCPKRRIIFAGASNGIIIALSSTSLNIIKNFGNDILRTFKHSSVDAMCLSSSSSRLMAMDGGRRIRLFDLGNAKKSPNNKKNYRLVRCWQPDTPTTDVSDVRHSVEGDRGTITYSALHRAFATSSMVSGNYCIQLWCEKTGTLTHSLSLHGIVGGVYMKPSTNKSLQEKKIIFNNYKIPALPILDSVGEFALEIDRMKLLENKVPMIHEILHAGENDFASATVAAGASGGDNSSKNSEVDEEININIDQERVHARDSLDYKLNKLHLRGMVTYHNSNDRAKRVKARKERSTKEMNLLMTSIQMGSTMHK
jgi:WD40 repeat protein